MNLLEIEKLNQFYGQSHTLWDVDFSLEAGQCTVVMGRNGVGKTTLLQTIMGHNPIASGTMRFDGIALERQRVEARPQLGIGYVPQGRQIFPLLSVEENLKIGFAALPRNQREISDTIFELFPVLDEMRNRRGGDLSGGQQQQLAIGRALVVNPKLLILDEPTEGIQPNIVAEIGDIIRRLNRELGLTVLLVEQKLPFARKVGDRFSIFDRGQHVASGDMPDLDQSLINQYLTV